MRTALIAGLVALASASAHATTPLPARGDHSVYDAASVIDPPTEARLEALDSELMTKAGVAIVIVTVPRLEGETIDQLAVRVQHDWGVGTRGKDESVVIVVSVEDHKIFIATGYGSEGYLPDGKVGEIRDHARDMLHAGNFAGGLLLVAQETAAVAAAAHHVTVDGAAPVARVPARSSGCRDNAPTLVFLALFLAFGLFGRRRGGGGGFFAGALLGSLFRGGGGGGGGSSGGGFGGFGGGSGGGGGAGGDF